MVTENIIASPEISSIPATAAPPTALPSVAASLRCVNPADYPDWDAQVLAQPRYTFFHGAAWAKVLQDTYGFTPLYYTDGADGKLQSLLPLMEVRSWLTGRRGVGLPFTDDSGPLGADGGTFRKLFLNAVEQGKARGWKSVECRGGRELLENAPASLAFYGHSVDLQADEDQLFARLESSVRRAVRKAEKSGVTTTVSRSADAMKTFYALQCKTRKKHGLPPQPFAFFQNIYKYILARNLGMIVMASHQDRPIAASVYFQLGERAIYKFGASDENFQQFRGTNLVMWEAIKWHARHGARTLHLGRSSLWNDGLRRSKLGWGAREDRIEYVKYDLQKGGFVADRDESSGWHTRVFQRMPISLSRLMGAVLYRHWA
jgi:CelD/BcsL family acetyltransferase involved in cellulose biosynthesis